MMLNFFKNRCGELTITAVTLFLTLLFFTPVTDDYGSLGCNLAAGQFSDYPYLYEFYLMLVGMGGMYRWLYHILPDYNWMGISFLAFNLLSLYLSLRLIKNLILKDSKNAYLLRIIQVLFSLFFIENIASITHTRASILFCGIGLFNIAFTDGISRKGILINAAIFALGMLIRPESSLGMLLLVSTGYLIYRFDIKHVAKRFLLPFVASAALFSYFTMDWLHTDIYAKKVEPEIEYKIMDRRIVDLSSMKTAEDSVKYQAVMVGMWFDLKTITPDFIRSLLLPGINLSAAHAASVFFHSLSYYKHYVFIACLVIALIFLSFFQTNSLRGIFRIVLFQISTFLIIYLVDFNGRLITERHFLNIQLISLLITSFYFFNPTVPFDFWKGHKILLLSCFLFVLFGTGATIVNYKQHNDSVAHSVNCYESAMQEIEDSYAGRIIVVTLSNAYLLDHNFSIKNKNYTKNTYLLFDAFTFSLLPNYMNYLSSQCQCNPADPVAFLNWSVGKNALYLAEAARYNLIEKYMRLIHHQKIKFISIGSLEKPDCIQSTEMKDYELRNIVVGD